ncbi:GNAT family N-acetyltransferase [Rhizobium bangladeshense]|uniref:GNAT family N-acetyltransferase n=1 Tax=Rhizobium bangladeshense TaxID=1138189 RepID=UPI0007E58BBA|nr:GNAT family N-acetyltransferase [Rhizobium bangladeshense]
MSEPIQIQPARRDDAAEISELVRHTIRVSNSVDYPLDIIERVASNFSKEAVLGFIANRDVWIARKDGPIIGTASLDGNTVRTVFVSPAAQGQGVGARLLEAVESAARYKGIGVLRVPDSLTAHAFYSRHSYTDLRELLHGYELTFLMENQLV